jgi:Protein of unknown function (DUF2796)
MKSVQRTLWLGALLLPAMALAEGKAHQHGVLKLDIAVEVRKLSLQVESPLDNLVGFERAPRNEAERKRVDAALARLKAGQLLFSIDPAAQCSLTKVELTSAVLKLGPAQPAPASKSSEHADIDAVFEFECQDAARAAFIDVGLFDAFAGMKQIEVQVATPTGQRKQTLKRPAKRVTLTR